MQNKIDEKLRDKFDIGGLIRQLLMDDTKLGYLVGEQIYPIIAPENTKGNYIVYVRDEYSIERTKQGITKQVVIVYVSCVSQDYDASTKMASRVYRALDGRYNISNEMFSIESILMVDSTEDYAGDCFVQTLQFQIK